MRMIDADKAIEVTWKEPSYTDPLNVLTEVRDRLKELPTVDAIPVQYILTTIREWNRDGYAESAEALEILVMNWDKENTEWAERKEE